MLKNKFLIFISLLFFTLAFIFAIYSDITSINTRFQNIVSVDKKLHKISSLKKLIKEIQKERGLTYIYYSNPIEKYFNALSEQRDVLKSLVIESAKDIDTKTLEKNLNFIHESIKTKTYTREQTFEYYTKLVFNNLIASERLLIYTNNFTIKNDLILYQQLNFIQEQFGQLRATVGGALTMEIVSGNIKEKILKVDNLLQNYTKMLNSYPNTEDKNIYESIETVRCVKETKNIIKKVLDKSYKSDVIAPLKWFSISTCAVNTVNATSNNYLSDIKLKVQRIQANLENLLIFHAIFWLFSVIIAMVILLTLFKINKKMLRSNELLEQYKKAIDQSTIVSKTDKYGVITYANKAFCEVSGYSESELIGKAHNIVRHPDMPKAAFKNVWDTIKSGKIWQGEVKNLKKDGGYYWVNATISPIYDNDSNLVEYIAIRHNNTKIHELNEDIKNTQHELIYRIGESVESRSKETGNHVRRVAKYSKLLASLHGLDNNMCENISVASTMHDVGKIAIPDSILLKPSKLTVDEWEIMKTHSYIGHKILVGSNLPILKIASIIAHEHHERYDAKGYPNGMGGEKISIYARIVSIVDVFDALMSDRVYKKAWSYDKVIKLLIDEKGKQFDPHLVDLFLANIYEFMKIKNMHED